MAVRRAAGSHLGGSLMAAEQITVKGLRQLRTQMRKAGMDMADMKEANGTVASIVAAAARAGAPRATGRLSGTVRGNRVASGASVRAGSASVPYANPIHWGWPRRNIAPNPWVSRAAQSTESAWREVYARAVDDILSKIEGER